MSSRPFYAPVYLNTQPFANLKTTKPDFPEWEKEWNACAAAGSTWRLIGLLHWGLQDALENNLGINIVPMICRYLKIADGHLRAQNFGHVPSQGYTSYKSPAEVKQEIADKAWMELCNRAFQFQDGDYGKEPKYWWYFAKPQVAEAFVKFINPYRWDTANDANAIYSPNIDRSLDHKCNYHRKALNFAKRFLMNAWDYKELSLRSSARKEMSQEQWENWMFFLRLRPRLIELMGIYGVLDFLYDRKIDGSTRKKLKRMAYSDSLIDHPELSADVPPLADLYGQREEGSRENTSHLIHLNREAARIVLLYPLLVKGQKEFVRAHNQKLREAKAAEAAKLREQADRMMDKIKTLEK